MKDKASPDEIGEALKELTAQACSGIGLEAPFTGLTVTRRQAGDGAGRAGRRGRQLRLPPRRGQDAPLRLQLRGRFGRPGASRRRPSPAPVAAPVPAAEKRPADNLELILDIDMPLTVRFGEATVSIEALCRLGPGSLVELSRQPDDPVDVLINGRLVARGEVVVVAGNYGVRVTQVVSADERMRTLNG